MARQGISVTVHSVVRSRVITKNHDGNGWQIPLLDTATRESPRYSNPETEREEISLSPMERAFLPILPNTEDVAKAVELLRAYMWDLREARPEDPTIQEIERVIHHLGYPIVRPDQIIK